MPFRRGSQSLNVDTLCREDVCDAHEYSGLIFSANCYYSPFVVHIGYSQKQSPGTELNPPGAVVSIPDCKPDQAELAIIIAAAISITPFWRYSAMYKLYCPFRIQEDSMQSRGALRVRDDCDFIVAREN
jgi:hypothetical protein